MPRKPTQRRPAHFRQHAEIKALVNRDGVVHRQEIRVFLATNISRPRDAKGKRTAIEGLDIMPSQPVVFRWLLCPPSSSGQTPRRRAASIDREGRFLDSGLPPSFVQSPLYLDTPPEVPTPECKSTLKDLQHLLQCLTEAHPSADADGISEATGVCGDGVMMKMVQLGEQCPHFHAEASLGSVLNECNTVTESCASMVPSRRALTPHSLRLALPCQPSRGIHRTEDE